MNRHSLFLLVLLLGAFGVYFNYIIHYSKPRVTETASVVLALPKTQPTVTAKNNLVPVTRVIDGDTIVVQISGMEEKVRLIGVDAPETVDSHKPIQCFGKEASDEMKRLLTGQDVLLKNDPTQDNKDKYGRLLRYVYLSDGTFVDEFLVEQGYAREYTYKVPYQFQKEFRVTEKNAKLASRGLWATCGV